MTRQYTVTVTQWNGQPCRHRIKRPITMEELDRLFDMADEGAVARIKWTHTLLSPPVAHELVFAHV